LLPQSQWAGEQRRHDEDRRTDDGESVKVATTGSSCSTELHTPDWMTGGRAGGHSSIRDGGSSQRAEKRTGRHELMAATGSSTADERAAGEAVKVQQIDDERVVDELLLLCRGGGPATTGRPRSAAGKAKSRLGGARSVPGEDDWAGGGATTDGSTPALPWRAAAAAVEEETTTAASVAAPAARQALRQRRGGDLCYCCCSLLLRLDLRVWGYWRSRPREGRSILPGTVQRR